MRSHRIRDLRVAFSKFGQESDSLRENVGKHFRGTKVLKTTGEVKAKIILVLFSVGRGQNFDYNATSISNFIGRADLDASLHRKFIASDNVSRTDPDIPYVDLIYRVASKKRFILRLCNADSERAMVW